MATVNGYKMDDIIDTLQSGRLSLDVNELFSLLKSQPRQNPKERPRDLQDLLEAVRDYVRC